METRIIQGFYNQFTAKTRETICDVTRIRVRNKETGKTSHWYADAPAREVMSSIIATEEAIAYALDIEPHLIEAVEVKKL